MTEGDWGQKTPFENDPLREINHTTLQLELIFEGLDENTRKNGRRPTSTNRKPQSGRCFHGRCQPVENLSLVDFDHENLSLVDVYQ